MAVNLLAIGNGAPFLDSSGNPLALGLLYTYVAGSSTPATTYTTSLGNVSNANPIVLDSGGYPAQSGSVVEIWGTSGVTFKVILKTAAAVTVWTRDNIPLINDVTATASEWQSGPTPTYISATSFSLVGDQTSDFHVGRRLKTTNSGGTVYSTIVTSAYGVLTTITVANDSGSLDSGLSAVSYGLLTALNPSTSSSMIYRKSTAIASAATTNIWNTAGDYVHITGSTGPITSFGTGPYAGAERTIIFDSTPTITHDATTLILPGAANIVAAAGDRAVVRADTTANMIVVSYIKASGVPVLGAASAATIKTGTNATQFIASDQLLAAHGFSGYFASAQQTITAAGALTLAHSLARQPINYPAFLINTSSELGYTAGQETSIPSNGADSATNNGVSIIPDATNLVIRYGSAANVFLITRGDTGAVAAIDITKWKLIIRAWG